MSNDRTPLFVRLPRNQAAALDRLADATGRRKQSLVSELLADRLSVPRQLSVGRVEVSKTPEVGDEVLTLEEAAKLQLEVSPMTGAAVQTLVGELARTPPAVAARVRTALEAAK